MKQLFLSIVFVFLFVLLLDAQEITNVINFDYTTIKKIVVTGNDIYAAGYVEIPGSSKQRDAFVARIDKSGDIIWQNSFGGKLFERINDICVSGDKIYATGVTWTKENRSQLWFVELTTDGRLLLEKNFGYNLNDGGYRIIKSDDRNFYLFGYSTPQKLKARNIWIVKVNDEGDFLWNKQIGAMTDNEEAVNALLLKDGMLVVARTWQSGISDIDPWLLMLSYSGAIIWQTKNHLYEDNYFVKPLYLQDRILLLGETWEKIRSKKGDIWFVSIDLTGKTLVDKMVGTFTTEKIKDVLVINDTIWTFGGYTKDLKASIWQLSEQGDIISQKVFDLPMINTAAVLGSDSFVIGGGKAQSGYVAFVRR
jgi:hypothetical protein